MTVRASPIEKRSACTPSRVGSVWVYDNRIDTSTESDRYAISYQADSGVLPVVIRMRADDGR
jgi:hypothetical protein